MLIAHVWAYACWCPDIVEPFSASLCRISTPGSAGTSDTIDIQTELQTASPLADRAGHGVLCLNRLHDLSLALELLLMLKAVCVLSLSGIVNLLHHGHLLVYNDGWPAALSSDLACAIKGTLGTDSLHSSAVSPRPARQGLLLGSRLPTGDDRKSEGLCQTHC